VVMLSSTEKKELAEESVKKGAYKYVSKKDASGHNVQNLVKNIIHDTLLDRETKENMRFNLIMGGSFFALVGIVIYVYLKYFY
jgi:DNA-binding NarL/FixJ family response regulator